MLPAIARQRGHNIRTGLMALVLLSLCIFLTILHAPKASAAGLLPELGKVELPIGGTPLEKVVAPVTNVTNDLLPLDISPSPGNLGVTVAPQISQSGTGQPSAPLVDVNVPVRDIVQEVTQPVAEVLGPITNPSSPTSPPTSPQSGLLPQLSRIVPQLGRTPPLDNPSLPGVAGISGVAAATQSPRATLARATGVSSDGLSYDAPLALASIAGSFGSAMPANWEKFSRSFFERPDYVPTIISVAIFLTVLAMIANVIYISNRGGFIWSGYGRLAKLSERYDLAQLSVAAVAIVGAGAVAAVLLISQSS